VDLFTNGPVRVWRITIAPEHLASLREFPRKEVPATVQVGETVCAQAGVHLKGKTGSFRPLDAKPAFTFDFAKFVPRQRFYGLRKAYLNNSVEDPSYLNESLGGELFRAAGVPAPRVTHARVELNGRALGLYVVKEGFAEEFLGNYFKNAKGNLYDNDKGKDVDEPMDRDSGKGRNDQADLQALATAAREPDLAKRWNRLQPLLAMDRFVSFMAMEIMTGHRDGYCLAKNNFRIYHDLDTDKMLWFPHGMDQLFGNPELTITPRMAGLMAKAVMETPEGRQRYRARCAELFTNVFILPALVQRAEGLAAHLRPEVPRGELGAFDSAVGAVKEHLTRRHAYLAKHVFEAERKVLVFANGTKPLTDWVAVDVPPQGKMDRAAGPGDKAALHIQAGPVTSASWRSKVLVARGRYRFEGSVCVRGVEPLAYGRNKGAGLQVGGLRRLRPDALTGNQNWQPQQVEFQVTEPESELELVCELRARQGEAWFAVDTLRLVQLPADKGDKQ
jgi:hypothetical protein